jgi:N-methylhydantoinase A/oxoprolinase/acetone carboxylase beta subunit
MTVLLGVDTGGTYTDAVLLDEGETRVLAKAKALTTRPDLAGGVGAAIDAVLAEAGVAPSDVAMVALSTTLATNALVEGQGGRVALLALGFDAADLERDGLPDAMRGDPVLAVAGGHDHAGNEAAPLDLAALEAGLAGLPDGLDGLAVAARFATRNPAHERAARDLARRLTGLPVTCSHELSSALGGPRRALTAVLNARLVGLIERLIRACEGHLAARGIRAPLMVVRGDGALMAAAVAHEKPIETILSGPAASVAGAAWLAREPLAFVSDIGGTTTDICLLRDGRPALDPEGARVGPWRTMVEAVAMRTWGLGGDSEVHLLPGLAGEIHLGPRGSSPSRCWPATIPACRTARSTPRSPPSGREEAGRFVLPLWAGAARRARRREAAVAARLAQGPLPLSEAIRARPEGAALGRLVTRGLAQVRPSRPPTPAMSWACRPTSTRRRRARRWPSSPAAGLGRGERLAEGPEALARQSSIG